MTRTNRDRFVAVGILLIAVVGLVIVWQVTRAEWAVQEKVQRKALQDKINGLAFRVTQKIAEGRRVDFEDIFGADLPLYDVENKINIGAEHGPNGEIIISGNTHGTGLMSSLFCINPV